MTTIQTQPPKATPASKSTATTKIPEVPYTAEEKIYYFPTTGEQVVRVEIRVKSPSRIGALLHENCGKHIIPSAGLWGGAIDEPLEDVRQRARTWKARRVLLEAIQDDLDDEILLIVSVRQWHAIGTLCGKLGITPGQWYLASAAYNAAINEREIDEMLTKIRLGKGNGGEA